LIVATAPGKAVLSGEYAVLHGAPAAAVAVDRRVRVSLAPAGGAENRLATAGYGAGERAFRVTGSGEVEWLEPLPGGVDFSLFETLWKHCHRAGRPPLAVSIDTRPFFAAEGGGKLGFGSSAAVAVALSAALQALDADPGPPGSRALPAHREFQGGRGSGIDVATSLAGGLVAFRRGATETLDWPAGLHYRFLWSGRSANTADRIGRLGAGDARQTETSIHALCQAAEATMADWRSGDGASVVAVMRRYVTALRRFSAELDLGIFDAGHAELADLAAGDGIVYKPCGAGGGDIGVVLALGAPAIEEFCRQAAPLGFRGLDVALDTHGLTIDGEYRA